MPKVSVVIPTLNRADRLKKTVELIERQTVPPSEYEVIVIDNNSTDHTGSMLAAQAARYPNLRSFSQAKKGAAATRNVGIREAKGDIILFIDDDIDAEASLIESHIRYHRQNPGSAIIGSVISPWANTTDPFLRYLRDHKIFSPYDIASGPLDFSYFHTGNVSAERTILLKAQGFNEEFSLYGMEDIELGYRLEHKERCHMVSGPEAQGIHQYFPTYDYFIDRCYQAGYSLGKLIELHPELKKRFTNRPGSRLLKRIHVCYRAFALVGKPFWGLVSRWEAGRGTGSVNTALGRHYRWGVRYHFFLGYNAYGRVGAGGYEEQATPVQQRIHGLAIERNE
ncbi:MAG TPA: glycosyltransferase [Terriglobia bacterium]|nr:glycosyltransferase [Terriglobia bacterium]